MSDLVKYNARDNVAVITVENPPVNALSPGVPEGIEAALIRAIGDDTARAIVVIGGGRTFIAGADISVLEQMAWGFGNGAPILHDLLAAIEDSPKPVVMAIHGTALGGGLEVAMAGHYRVASASAQLGQPEVNLGIIPGAEGTQRLPRLVGVERAIDMCVSGKPLGAAEALSAGLIDKVVEGDLLEGAVQFAASAAPGGKTRERTAEGSPQMYEAGRAQARKIRRSQEAPLKVVDAIEAASLPFDEGCRRERELFDECLKGSQAKALIHAFFAERRASKIPGIDAGVTEPVKRVAIVGAGTMGSGIAMACANSGIEVRMRDTTDSALDRGMANIARNYDSSVKRGRFTAEQVTERLNRIRPQLDSAGFDQADVVIEAVFENMALKKEIFRDLDAVARPGAVLATNTSTLDIDAIASVTSRPENVIGLHFFSPANVMRLLEVVRGAKTSKAVIATAMSVAKQLKKVGVLARNRPGFIGNRMFLQYMYETQFLAEEGATPSQVDAALTDFGMAMGMFAVDDMAGIDVAVRVREQSVELLSARGRRPLIQDELFRIGRYGQKTGRGWYTYGEDRKSLPDPEVEALIERLAREAGVARRGISNQEIVDRSVCSLINEGAALLDEGVALRASDIDVVYATGYGFPAWRGGPLFYADLEGLPNIVERMRGFEAEHGSRWTPAPLLVRLAVEGRTFRDYDRERSA